MRFISLLFLLLLSISPLASWAKVGPAVWITGEIVNNSFLDWQYRDLIFTTYGQNAWAASLTEGEKYFFIIEQMQGTTNLVTVSYKSDAIEWKKPLCRLIVSVSDGLTANIEVENFPDSFIKCEISQDKLTNKYVLTTSNTQEISNGN